MFLKQLSVFIANEPGRLSDIAELIASEGIDIRAISVADTADFGILRLIVNRPERACEILLDKGLSASLTEVLAVGIDDRPGGFASVLRALRAQGIEVEYMYAFIGRAQGEAYLILRVDDNAAAENALEEAGFMLLAPESVYKI